MTELNQKEANDIVDGSSDKYRIVEWSDEDKGRWVSYHSGICENIQSGKFYRMPTWQEGLTENQKCDPYYQDKIKLVEVDRVETKKTIEVVSVEWREA